MVDNMYEFQHSSSLSLSQIAHFDARFASLTRKKARLPTQSVKASDCRNQVSIFTINTDNCLFLFLCWCHVPRVSVFVSGSADPLTRSTISVSPSSCSGVWDPFVGHHILPFEQHNSTETMIGILPIFAQFCSFLNTEVCVLNLFWYLKIPCIFVFSWMYCFQLIHRMILFLQHSMLSSL